MRSLYKPLGEKEVMEARFNILPDGEYDGKVMSSKESVSRSGNVMADMTVILFDKEGKRHSIRDFLVFMDTMLWKVKHFCDSSGQQKIYEEGKFAPEFAEGKMIRAVVGRKAGGEIPHELLNGKPPGSCYPDRNVILDYVEKSGNSVDNPVPMDNFMSDPIPF